jgi:predicted nucleotide-binding protein (sugar kinase/HSP70/actin superfamily)
LKVGLPRGLYYFKYDTFLDEFLRLLGADVVVSPETNKNILIDGVNACVDDACLPIKIYHGHVQYLRDKCDLIIVPRIMEMEKKVFICPKFCGLPEMLQNSIPGLPRITEAPMHMHDEKHLLKWCGWVGRFTGAGRGRTQEAFARAYEKFRATPRGINDGTRTYKVALLGHAYNIYDRFANMDAIQKLADLDVGVITEECVPEKAKTEVYKSLLISPFWSSIKEILGAGMYLAQNKLVDGIVYLSSFQCGIDSVNVDLLKDFTGKFPLLVLKLDEHSGAAGIETRLEAFVDMLKRRQSVGYHVPSYGQYIFGS